MVQKHAKQVAESSQAMTVAAEEQAAAAAALAVAKAAAASAEEAAKKTAAAAAASAKILDCPPAPLVLHAQPLSESDALDCRTLGQVLAYTVEDSKVRLLACAAVILHATMLATSAHSCAMSCHVGPRSEGAFAGQMILCLTCC
jgi:hypothetical protein